MVRPGRTLLGRLGRTARRHWDTTIGAIPRRSAARRNTPHRNTPHGNAARSSDPFRGVIRPSASDRDRGSVAAEFAVCLPAIVLLLGVAVGAVQVATQQLRVQDAAIVTARLVARGDGNAAAATAANLIPGASVAVEQRTTLVCVRVSTSARIAAGRVSSLTLRAHSCAPRAEM